MLVTDVIGVDGEIIVFAISETVANDFNTLFEGGFTPGHGGAGAVVARRFWRAGVVAVLFDPGAQLGAGANIVFFADVALTATTGLVVFNGLPFELRRVVVVVGGAL